MRSGPPDAAAPSPVGSRTWVQPDAIPMALTAITASANWCRTLRIFDRRNQRPMSPHRYRDHCLAKGAAQAELTAEIDVRLPTGRVISHQHVHVLGGWAEQVTPRASTRNIMLTLRTGG